MKTSNAILQQLQSLTGEAIEVVRQLLRDPNTPQSVRLGAARLILTASLGGGDDEPAARAMRTPHNGPHMVLRARGPKPDRVA